MFFENLRRDYDLTRLSRSDLAPDPLLQFKKWFDEAAGIQRSGRFRKFLIKSYKIFATANTSQTSETNACTLATTDKQGCPSARVVLLKEIDERGFIFFTNYESRKGRELAENPQAALVFYWSDQARQVCISGTVEKIPRTESESYFKTRPRGSRLAAWASSQSTIAENRAALEMRWNEMAAKFPGDDIPTPPNWGGFVLSPKRIEFWQGRPSRLHDRFCYLRQPENSWRVDRLYP
jgi:pyridoxamine 5'-phosphate oxidase